MKKLLFIAFLSGFGASSVYSQLLEDTDGKLKNTKVEKNGFLFFKGKKKIKNSDGISSGKFRKSGLSSRYAGTRSPFKSIKKTSPRYSSGGNTSRRADYKIMTKYSPGSPFSRNRYRIRPRYSESSSKFKNSQFAASSSSIKYSRGILFSGRDYHIKVKYSEGTPFRGQEYVVSPRYTDSKYGFFKRVSNGELFAAQRYRESSLWKGNNVSMRPPIVLHSWDKFWSKINGESPQEAGMKDAGKKAKFDKKERVIWNN